MKITIRHGAGMEIAFEGDVAEFERFTALLGGLPEFVGTLAPTSAQPTFVISTDGDEDDDAAELEVTGRTVVMTGHSMIDVHEVAAQLAQVGARTDIDRVTVMTWMAEKAGIDGIDYGTAERLYDELGEPKPAKMRATFSNAKMRGLVRSVGQGRWKSTVAGQNFARYGTRESRGRRAGIGRGQQASLPAGGDPDS